MGAPLGQWLHGALLNGLSLKSEAGHGRGARDLVALEDGIAADDKSEDTRSEGHSLLTSKEPGSKNSGHNRSMALSSTEADTFQFNSLNWRFSAAVKRAGGRVTAALEELHFH